jgi:hypothetical protein
MFANQLYRNRGHLVVAPLARQRNLECPNCAFGLVEGYQRDGELIGCDCLHAELNFIFESIL